MGTKQRLNITMAPRIKKKKKKLEGSFPEW